MIDTSRRGALGLLATPLLAVSATAAQATTPNCASRAGHPINPDDWGGQRRYTDANRELQASGRPCDIVFIGDSITEGWPDKRPDFFSAGRIGRGIGGQTTPQMLTRMMTDVVRLRPAIVHIMGGTNDVAGNTGPIDAEQTRDAVQAMVAIARHHDIKVLLGSILPAARFPWRPGLETRAEIAARNHLLAALASSPGVQFVDYTPALADATGTPRPGMTYDGVHPSADGYSMMQAVLAPHL